MFTAIMTCWYPGNQEHIVADTLGTAHANRDDAKLAAKKKWGDSWQRVQRYRNPTKIQVVADTDQCWAYLFDHGI